jgi:voltage-gated sodium channel
MKKNLEKIEFFFEKPQTHKILAFIIAINAIFIGLETLENFKTSTLYKYVFFFDQAVIGIFTFEVVIKIIAMRVRFFKNYWHWFDVFIVLISLIPSTGALVILRSARIFRVLWLIELSPHMKVIVNSIKTAIPGILSVSGILLIVFYMSSVMSTNLFGKEYPEFFGSLYASSKTLYQLMLGDNWGNVVNVVCTKYPYAYIFFVIFSVTVSFTILNLFVALVVTSMHRVTEKEINHFHEDLEGTQKKIMQEIWQIKKILKDKS